MKPIIIKWTFDWDMFEYGKLFIFKWTASLFKKYLIKKYGKQLKIKC